jgi:hypothetical protein
MLPALSIMVWCLLPLPATAGGTQVADKSPSELTFLDCLELWQVVWDLKIESLGMGPVDEKRSLELLDAVEEYEPLLDKCRKAGFDSDSVCAILRNKELTDDTMELWRAAEAKAAEAEAQSVELDRLFRLIHESLRDSGVDSCAATPPEAAEGGARTVAPPDPAEDEGDSGINPVVVGGVVSAAAVVAVVALGGEDEADDARDGCPPLPSRVALEGSKRSDSCGQGTYPERLSNPGVSVSFDGTNLIIHSSADVTGPFSCSSSQWTGQGAFEGPFGTGTETYAGSWTFENNRWVFRGTLTFQYADCVVVYDVQLTGVG